MLQLKSCRLIQKLSTPSKKAFICSSSINKNTGERNDDVIFPECGNITSSLLDFVENATVWLLLF